MNRPKARREEISMKIVFRNKTYEFDHQLRVKDLLSKLELNREAFLISVDGKLVTEDELIPVDAEVKIIPVVSGG